MSNIQSDGYIVKKKKLMLAYDECPLPRSQSHPKSKLPEATFHIPQGNLVVLSGNRGSGKKTVLELMAGEVGTGVNWDSGWDSGCDMSTCSSTEQIQRNPKCSKVMLVITGY